MRGNREVGFVFEIGPDNALGVTLFRDCSSAELGFVSGLFLPKQLTRVPVSECPLPLPQQAHHTGVTTGFIGFGSD
jgi:hypothetical protein